jgi:hypothetical protein
MCGLASGQAAGRCPVSVEATSWALNLAPVPAHRGGQTGTGCTPGPNSSSHAAAHP